MTRILKPSQTLMFGRAMLNQFGHELKLFGSESPVIITLDPYRKRALRAASMINYPGDGIAVNSGPGRNDDFLILAGGKNIVDRWSDDLRPKAWLMLGDEDLQDFTEPVTEFIIADTKFLHNSNDASAFMRKFALSVSDGMASVPGKITIPPAFTYSCKTMVHAGENALAELPGLLSETKYRMSRPMILTDKGIVAVGLFENIKTVLEGIDYEVFDDIPPDSSSSVVNEISRLFTEKKCDGIIAVGGGSVLDTGKGVFLNVSLGEDDLAVLAGSNIIPELYTPFIAVPTTSGTGSEVTKAAVISDSLRQRKILYISPKLMPQHAVLDSRLTASLPAHLTTITGMDALSHAVEAYTCLGKNPISDQMAWKAVTLIRDNLKAVMTEPENLELRYNLSIASNFAGQAFSNSMVGMVHTIGHSIGAVCHAPHGSCMSALLPAVLEYNYEKIDKLLEELLPALTGEEQADEIEPEQRAKAAIDAIRQMNRELKELTGGRHPTGLADILGRNGEPLITREHFKAIAETSLGDASIVYNPVELRMPDIIGVLEASYKAE